MGHFGLATDRETGGEVVTHANALIDSQEFGRGDLLKKGLIGGGVVAAALVAPGLTGTAQASGGKMIALDVDTNGFADFQGGAPGSASYVSGDIAEAGTSGPSLGTFHCWGFIRLGDELGVVTQEFSIDRRGKIIIAGVESADPRAVVGGTDDFANARGQGVPNLDLFDFPNSGRFRITFDLTGASGSPIG